jgi:sugar lactone lactonase YvrE
MLRTLFLTIAILGCGAVAYGQGKGVQMPAPLGCGVHGDAEVICGTRAPEDLEVTPDGKFLVVPQFVTGPGGPGLTGGVNGLYLFDLKTQKFSKLTAIDQPQAGWGDASCPGPIGSSLGPHGTSLVKRSKGGAWQLYVVNHAVRQSVEMYELKKTAGNWTLLWHGCVPSTVDYNDVAALADGGFVATYPTGIQAEAAAASKDGKGKQVAGGAFGGQPTGFLVRWTPGQGQVELPGTRTPYPNGVVATPDGKTAYYAVYASKEARRYDLVRKMETGVVKLDFMPDNLIWTKKGNLLAAGIKGLNGECPANSGQFCRQAFAVDAINPGVMTRSSVYDSNGKGNLIPGVSSALAVDGNVYIGAFEGDRIVKVRWKE